jgi:hypothetical protein
VWDEREQQQASSCIIEFLSENMIIGNLHEICSLKTLRRGSGALLKQQQAAAVCGSDKN